MKTEILILITCIIGMILTGCTQRVYQHDATDPNGISHTYYYQSNSIASDASATSVEVTTAEGTVLRLFQPEQKNDSIEVWTPWGIMTTESKGK